MSLLEGASGEIPLISVTHAKSEFIRLRKKRKLPPVFSTTE